MGCVAGFALGHFLDFNLMQSRRLLPFSFFAKRQTFQSFAVIQTASAIAHNDYILLII